MTADGRLTVAEIKTEMAARGFSYVLTYGGPMPLSRWVPYGREIEGTYLGRIRPDGKLVDATHEAVPPFVNGVWTFLTDDQAADIIAHDWDIKTRADELAHVEHLDALESERA